MTLFRGEYDVVVLLNQDDGGDECKAMREMAGMAMKVELFFYYDGTT